MANATNSFNPNIDALEWLFMFVHVVSLKNQDEYEEVSHYQITIILTLLPAGIVVVEKVNQRNLRLSGALHTDNGGGRKLISDFNTQTKLFIIHDKTKQPVDAAACLTTLKPFSTLSRGASTPAR